MICRKRALMQFCTLLFACTVLSCTSENSTNDTEGRPGFFTAVHSPDILKASLDFDLDSLVYHKDANTEDEVDGRFEIALKDSTLNVPVELRSRGVTRKNLCAVPPIRLQVKKKAVASNGWGPYRNYKLVTHCSDTAAIDDLLLREYLVYKMYEAISDFSLRTQLLQLTYITPSGESEHFAFLIENVDEMNDRLGLTELDVESSGLSRIHFDHYKRFAMFQYMVMNTDWNLGSSHNTKFVLEKDSESPIVIPYDFDYCGMVNAPYARPYETLPIGDVRERYFMYRGKKADDFDAIIQEFVDKREELSSIIQEFPYLSDKSKADMLECLESFYGTISQPDWKDRVFPT